jgi:hypothetical protein
MTHHKTHALKPVWFHHKPHSPHRVKRFDRAVPAIILGLCLTLITIYAWSFYLYQSILLP